MKKKKYFFIIALFFICFTNVTAKKIELKADWALFPYQSNQYLMEVYYRFLESGLHFKKNGNVYAGCTVGNWQMFRNDTLFGNYYWKNQRVVEDTASSSQYGEIINQVNGTFPKGTYQCKFIVSDLENSENKDSTVFEITIPSQNGDSLELSDIELAVFIQKPVKASDSPFFKNNMIVVPNPGGAYIKNARVYFYVEAKDKGACKDKKYNIQYFLRDQKETWFSAKRQKPIQWDRGLYGYPQIGSIDTDTLKEGNYTLVVNVNDPQGMKVASREKTIVLSPPPPPAPPALTEAIPDREFLSMDSVNIELEFQYLRYLLTPDAKVVWQNISNFQGRRNFVYSYWQNYVEMIQKEYRTDRQGYLSRIQYANSHFKVFNKAGWKTDRGRIYALHGEPDIVDRYPNEPNLNPYEIWHYQKLQNAVLFVFCDLAGHRDYELIHSTLIGEVKNYDYMEVIRRGTY